MCFYNENINSEELVMNNVLISNNKYYLYFGIDINNDLINIKTDCKIIDDTLDLEDDININTSILSINHKILDLLISKLNVENSFIEFIDDNFRNLKENGPLKLNNSYEVIKIYGKCFNWFSLYSPYEDGLISINSNFGRNNGIYSDGLYGFSFTYLIKLKNNSKLIEININLFTSLKNTIILFSDYFKLKLNGTSKERNNLLNIRTMFSRLNIMTQTNNKINLFLIDIINNQELNIDDNNYILCNFDRKCFDIKNVNGEFIYNNELFKSSHENKSISSFIKILFKIYGDKII